MIIADLQLQNYFLKIYSQSHNNRSIEYLLPSKVYEHKNI